MRFTPVVLLLVGCATTSQPVAPSPLLIEHWSTGNLRGARDEIERLSDDERLLGRLVQAELEDDSSTVEKIVVSFPKRTAADVLLQATQSIRSVGLATPEARALLARACQLPPSPRLDARIRDACSLMHLYNAHPMLRRCVKGCDLPVEVPLAFAGNSPAVRLSVGSVSDLPFIIDTGASTSVVTPATAARLGWKAIAGTEVILGSSAGEIRSHFVVGNIRLAGIEVADVPFAVIDLPIEGVAGILSPHDVFRTRPVTLDFRRFIFSVGETATQDTLVRQVWNLIGGNPILYMRTAQRPTRPLLVDTGAFGSTLSLKWDSLGPPLQRVARTMTSSAGGKSAAAFSTNVLLPARFGDLAVQLSRPTLVDTHIRPDQWIHRYGLVGMDVFMGRILHFHRSEKILALSPRAELAHWPKDTRARFSLTTASGRSEVEEMILDVDAGYVVLEMRISGALAHRLRLRFADNWDTRGSWFFTRPSTQVQVGNNAFSELDKKTWRQLLGIDKLLFRSIPGKISIALESVTVDGRNIGCNRLTFPVVVGASNEPGTMRLLECPSEPWRVHQVEVRTPNEMILDYRRVGMTTQQPAS